MQREKILDISWGTISKLALAILFFYVIYAIRDILVWFVFALVISVLFNPVVDYLQRKKIPRIVAVVFVYVAAFGIISSLIYMIVPIFVSEIHQFVQNFPDYFEKISPPLRDLGFEAFESFEVFLESFGNTLSKMASNIFNVLFAVFGGVFSAVFVISTAFFLSLEEKAVEKTLILLFPKKYEVSALQIWGRCQRKVAAWFGARLLASLFVGVVSYITFLLFGVKYAFTLGLFAGVFNFVPYIGPLVTGIILFILIAPLNIFKAVFVLVAFTLIQQIEGNILSPILMKKIVGIPPALVLVALVVGGNLWGFMGAILVVPLAGILFEFVKEFLQKKKEREVAAL